MKIKTHNMMFSDASYSFSMLKFYYRDVTCLLNKSANDFDKYADELEIEYKKNQNEFDKQHWLKHFDVYEKFYPILFNNSFLISACALFEYQIRKICDFAKKEHEINLEWDEMKGTVPTKAKRFLWVGGIMLQDDPAGSFRSWIANTMPEERYITVKELWQELENYFMIRNCLTHNNGVVEKSRNPEKVKNYAIEKKIIKNNSGRLELDLTKDLDMEVCDAMKIFFDKLHSAYYSTPLPT